MAAQHLNKRLHQQAKAFTNRFKQKPQEILEMNLSTLVESADQTLMGFIQELTKPIRDSKRVLFDENQPHEGISQEKQIKHFYALCLLLFNTNTMCNMPFHFTLTEAILCHGGSSELVNLFNKLGIVSSLDTNNRIATSIVEMRTKEGIKPLLSQGALSVISIDNVDILQPHAIVSSLDATRSWHGTSVQCIQPLPQSTQLTEEEKATTTSAGDDQPQSPIPVQPSKRRRRTLMECSLPHTELATPPRYEETYRNIMEGLYTHKEKCYLTKNHFIQQTTDLYSIHQLKEDIFKAMLLKYYKSRQGTSITPHHLPSLPILVHGVRKQTSDTEVSNVVYVNVLSERADCKATLKRVIGNLHKTFILELNQKWMLVIGDAKVYTQLQSIRQEYGNHLNWLIPIPGDWHVLYNYQKVLMKAYGDAGLINLAKTAGYRAETLNSLMKATNFRRTHLFLLQAYEAFYNYFLSLYLSQETDKDNEIYDNDIRQIMVSLIHKFTQISSSADEETFRTALATNFCSIPHNHNSMDTFMKGLSQKQDTINFWYKFISEDCFAYLSLFVSIRYRNWSLRAASIKQLSALFSAFDSPTYQSIIAQHLADLANMPQPVRMHLEKGAFAVRLSKSEGHAVALDECHEMCINKDSKLAIVRPTNERMDFLSKYLPFRSACLKNIKGQLFNPPQKELINHISSRSSKSEENTLHMTQAISSHGMFISATENKGLHNFLENKEATPEQAHDLMSMRAIGQSGFESFVKTKYLQGTSTDAPVRKKRLCTFTTTKAHKQKTTQIERERKLQQQILKRQLAWFAEKGVDQEHINELFGPVSGVPRALVDKHGLPYKSAKATITPYLERRYKSIPVVLTTLPWVPTAVILEGMFIIQTEPFPTMETMDEYVQMLMAKYVKPHFHAGVREVHILFDNPGALPETPKEIEQKRRDEHNKSQSHTCVQLQHSQEIPHKWRELLSCRKCKRNLTIYIATAMLESAPGFLTGEQEFITNIQEIAYSINCEKEKLPRPCYYSNADESDTRVWLHCIHAVGPRKLIYSPDTDVYQIGLTMQPILRQSHVLVQQSKSTTNSPKFIDMTALCNGIKLDSDLSAVQEEHRCQSIQSLYVSTGCDYVSFFTGLGKASFLSAFFQYAKFIASGDPIGSIGHTQMDEPDASFLSFVRLVGCTYFKAHSSAFKLETPVAQFYSVENPKTPWDHHAQWLSAIRKEVWLRADNDSKTVPSIEALQLHWKRSVWVIGMWHMSIENDMELPALTRYGWCRAQDNSLEVVWDTPENIRKVQERIAHVLEGCKCRTGCTTKRCRCQKNNKYCGPGCQCLNCNNMTMHKQAASDNDLAELLLEDMREAEKETSLSEESGEETGSEDDNELENIMANVFGPEESDQDLL